MPRLTWDTPGERLFQTGVDRGVLYLPSQDGVPWSGLISIDEKPIGGEAKPFYIDGVKYLNVPSSEEFSGTINAYTYPDEFAACDGTVSVRTGLRLTHQRRVPFSLSYRTLVGNDVVGLEYGYKIHILYNLLAAPSDWSNQSIAGSVEPGTFSWDVTACPPAMDGYRRTAHVVIDSTETDESHLAVIEDFLYGNELAAASLPTLAELITIYDTDLGFNVTDNGDGTWTAVGSSTYIQILDPDNFIINVSTAVPIDAETYGLDDL
jgi:hypothetical protein